MRIKTSGFVALLALVLSSSLVPVRAAGPQTDVEQISVTVGSVELTTYDPVRISEWEASTDFIITAHNAGASPVTLTFQRPDPPSWSQQLFVYESINDFNTNTGQLELAAGETHDIRYFVSKEQPGDSTVAFEFSSGGSSGELPIRFIGLEYADQDQQLPKDAVIKGRVLLPNGDPAKFARVEIIDYDRGAAAWHGGTGDTGRFSIKVASMATMEAYMYGPRYNPFESLGHHITVTKNGMRAEKFNVEPSPDEPARVTMKLRKKAKPISYELVQETPGNGQHGIQWLLPDDAFEEVTGVQGRHPPELLTPGWVRSASYEDGVRWTYDTAHECWGFHRHDRLTGIGCHDGLVAVIGDDGEALWEFDATPNDEVSPVRMVKFSRDGELFAYGPVKFDGGGYGVKVVDTMTGEQAWADSAATGGEIPRGFLWSSDDQRLYMSGSSGDIYAFTRAGQLIWKAPEPMGQFAFLFEELPDGSIVAAGKSRTVNVYSSAGELLSRTRYPGAVFEARRYMGGNLLVLPVYDVAHVLVDGVLKWSYNLPGFTFGHADLDITPDGSKIVVGDNYGNVIVLDRYGRRLWKSTYAGTPIVSNYNFNHTGVKTIAISDDGARIAAGYGDGAIRLFQLVP